jgi:hypothetical protein
MKHALTQATIFLVVLIVALRVLACVLPPLMPYLALLFVMLLTGRAIWHKTR